MSDSTEKHTEDWEQALDDANECLGDIKELSWKFPTGALIDYAHRNGLSASVIEDLEKLGTAAAVLVCGEGEEGIWNFAREAGMTDELTAWVQDEEEALRRFEEDPNSLISKLRRG